MAAHMITSLLLSRDRCVYVHVRTAWRETFVGKKTSANPAVWWLAKVFSAKFGGVVSFGLAKASNLRKFSPRENLTFHQFAKVFSRSKVSHYGTSFQPPHLYFVAHFMVEVIMA